MPVIMSGKWLVDNSPVIRHLPLYFLCVGVDLVASINFLDNYSVNGESLVISRDPVLPYSANG